MFDKLLMAAAQPVAATDSDQYIANTELLLKGEGTNGQTNSTFVDSSASSHSISRTGDVTQGSFSPFSPKGWSMYVDGTGTTQGIAGPNVGDVFSNSGKDSWTIEIWWKLDGLSTGTGTGEVFPIFSSKDWWGNGAGAFYLTYTHSTNLFDCQFNYNNNGSNAVISGLQSSVSFEFNRWYHLAVVKQGNTFRLYVDGQQLDTESAANLTTYGFWRTNYPVTIGRWWTIQTGYSQNLLQRHGRGYFSNARITNSAVYPDGTTFTPSTEPLTAITDCTLLTLQDNRYVDNSSLNSTITAYDSAAIKPTSPFSGNREYQKASYFSGYFDGSNDYLEISNTSNFKPSGAFTVECWFKTPDNTHKSNTYGARLISGGDSSGNHFGVFFNSSDGRIGFFFQGSYDYHQTTPTENVWHHVAYVRDSSNVIKIYLDGVPSTNTITNSSATAYGNNFFIGRNGDGFITNEGLFKGEISNFRFVNGTCLYTASFTPPTAPLTPVANTKLLTLQDNYLVDHSPSGHSITNNGGVTLEPESPFNNSTYPLSGTFYSANFDSTNDVISTGASSDFAFGTGDFTWECWFNRQGDTLYARILNSGSNVWSTNSAAGIGVYGSTHHNAPNKIYFYSYNLYSGGRLLTSTESVISNKWYHVAVTRRSGTLYLYVNGVLQNSNSSYAGNLENVSTNTFHVSGNASSPGDPLTENFVGYVSNVRVVKGTALYTSDFTVPSEPLTAVSGTKLLTLQDATIQDNSASSHSITNNGATVTEIAPFGAALIDRAGSMFFDGAGDYLDLTANLQQTGQFTIEFWFYAKSIAQDDTLYVWGNNQTYMNPCRFASTTSLGFYKYGVGLIAETGTNTVQPGQWYHVAVTKNSSNTLRIWLNGVLKDTYSFGSDPYGNTAGVHIGANEVPNQYFNGFISNFRCVSSCLYTSNFTPPTAPLQPITNTKLLLNGNNGGVEDSLGKQNLSTGGDAQIDTTVKKFGSGAIQFDGNGDFLKGTGFDFSGKYTIEGWIYRQTSSGYLTIFRQGGSTHDWATTGVHCLMYIEGVTNKLVLEIPDGSGYRYEIKSASSFPLNVNTWYHFAATCDGTNTSLFIDGQRVGTRQNIIPRVGGSEYEISIGANDGITAATNGSYFVGFMDDFRVTIGVARYDPTQTTHTVPTKTHPTV